MMSDDTSVSSDYIRNKEELFEYNHGQVYDVFEEIKHNCCGFKHLCLTPEPALSVEEWVELGNNIGRNTQLQTLWICADGIEEEEDEIASTENLEEFLIGLANNRSLQELNFEEYDFSRVGFELLHPFVMENDSLVELAICNCELGLHDLQMLANAFRNRKKPTSMKCMKLPGPTINDESIPVIIEICSFCPHLTNFDLVHSRFGRQGCIYLAAFLENPRCTLKHLDLSGIDTVDDDIVQLLANALHNNNKLKSLKLRRCYAITASGWEHLLGILHSTSDINAASSSNHTLVDIHMPEIFANCGKEGAKNVCNKCKLVKYCNAVCKRVHKKKHKKECDEHVRLAAELRDIELFKQPPPPEDCPICFLQKPTLGTSSKYMSCCGKTICSGCVHAPLYDNQGNKVDNQKCPFCRTPKPISNGKFDQEIVKRATKRMEAGDPIAIFNRGYYYSEGVRGFPKDHTKALELFHRSAQLGYADAYCCIGRAYENGTGVEVDEEKAIYYYGLAAMAGDVELEFGIHVKFNRYPKVSFTMIQYPR